MRLRQIPIFLCPFHVKRYKNPQIFGQGFHLMLTGTFFFFFEQSTSQKHWYQQWTPFPLREIERCVTLPIIAAISARRGVSLITILTFNAFYVAPHNCPIVKFPKMSKQHDQDHQPYDPKTQHKLNHSFNKQINLTLISRIKFQSIRNIYK